MIKSKLGKSNPYVVVFIGLFLFVLFSSQDCSHDKNSVTGKVFPAGMSVPMQNVMVQVKGNDTTRVYTDGNGFFKVWVSSFPVELLFIKDPYQKQVITVKKPSDIVVYMHVPKK